MAVTPEASSEVDRTQHVSSTPPGKVAFLVHSVHTLTENLPPEVDDKSLARQRRRRTSPEDQKILEDEFHKNPRPDKAARKDIVSRVSLGDKEVQIWFQNRRQNSRRKAKSLGLDVVLSSDASELSESMLSESSSRTLSDGLAPSSDGPETDREPALAAPETQITTSSLTSSTANPPTQDTRPSSAPEPSSSHVSESQTTFSSQGSMSTGYLANRRSINNSHLEYDEETETALPAAVLRKQEQQHSQVPQPAPISRNQNPSQSQSQPQPRTLTRSSSSYLRLSMTNDGNAKIVDRAVQSPSPERPQAIVLQAGIVSRLGSLRRSYSAAGLDEASHVDNARELSRKMPRTSAIGRSRDSRTWEFWCDTDARSSLIERADQENSGSAIEAIGKLKRSNSSRALQLNTSKLNSPLALSRNSDRVGKSARQGLKRSHTHHGGLAGKPATKKATTTKKTTEPDEYEIVSTESDKENWEPSSKLSRPTQNTSFVRGQKRVLGENTTTMSLSSSLGSMMAREQVRGSSAQSNLDSEVSSFVGHSRTTSTGDDLDCVQSLLSLSQAKWA